MPDDATYHIGFTVNGLTLNTGDLSGADWAAGTPGTSSLSAYWGSFQASPGTNQVIVTLDPDQSVAESSYDDNTFTFTFDAATPAVDNPSYTVAQIRAAYGLDSLPTFGGATADGSGQTIAIVDADNSPDIFTDLDSFDQAMSLTTNSTQNLYQLYGPSSSS